MKNKLENIIIYLFGELFLIGLVAAFICNIRII